MMGDRTRGLYGKFHVTRNDGKSAHGEKHDGCEYFVLDLTHDPFAIPALAAYAEACRAEYPLLARDLDAAVAVPRFYGEQEPREPVDVIEWANEETAGLMHVILQCDGEEHDEGSCECALAIREALVRARLAAPTQGSEERRCGKWRRVRW